MSEALTNFGYAFIFIAIIVGGGVTYLGNKAAQSTRNSSLPPSTIPPANNQKKPLTGGIRHTRRVHRIHHIHRNKTRRS